MSWTSANAAQVRLPAACPSPPTPECLLARIFPAACMAGCGLVNADAWFLSAAKSLGFNPRRLTVSDRVDVLDYLAERNGRKDKDGAAAVGARVTPRRPDEARHRDRVRVLCKLLAGHSSCRTRTSTRRVMCCACGVDTQLDVWR